MDQQTHSPQSALLARIDYASAFRFTRLFDCFRIAIHPSRMLMALLLILLLYVGGRILDVAWGRLVLPGEFEQYVQLTPPDFAAFVDRNTPKPDAAKDPRVGAFDAALLAEVELFEKMIRSVMRLHIGFDQLVPGTDIDDATLIGSIRKLCLLPKWMWDHHTGFLVTYLMLFGLIWALLSGALARSAMVAAATGAPGRAGRTEPATRCVAFAWRRFGWFLVTPLIPLLLVGLLALLLALGGLVLFNVDVLDILGGLFYIVALGLGLVMAVLLIGWVGGVHLMYPALVAEGTDGFDAVSRGYSYFFAHPWRMALYSLVAMIYGAAAYLVVGLFVFVTVFVTHEAVGAWVFRDAGPAPSTQTEEKKDAGLSLAQRVAGTTATPAPAQAPAPSRFDAMFPTPEFGHIVAEPESKRLNWSGRIASTLLVVWHYLMLGLVAAFVLSFYHAAYAVIYLLLRRQTDGTDPAELFQEPAPAPAPAPSDKVEPTPAPSFGDAPPSQPSAPV